MIDHLIGSNSQFVTIILIKLASQLKNFNIQIFNSSSPLTDWRLQQQLTSLRPQLTSLRQ